MTVHRVKALETARRHNLPVTTPLRTILDLAATASDRDLNTATTEARIRPS